MISRFHGTYDPFSRKVSREELTSTYSNNYHDRFSSSTNRESYLYDGLGFNVLAEGYDVQGNTTRNSWQKTSSRTFNPTSEYLMTNGQVIVRSDISNNGYTFLQSLHSGYLNKEYYCQDSLGSIIGLLNESGSLSERYNYDSFGLLIEGSFDGTNNLGYNGKMIDVDTGRYNYGFRDYDPLVKRWTTVDPIHDGSNWYAYVGNDPVNYVDLWGLETIYSYTENSSIESLNYSESYSYSSTDYDNLSSHRENLINSYEARNYEVVNVSDDGTTSLESQEVSGASVEISGIESTDSTDTHVDNNVSTTSHSVGGCSES